MLSLFTKVYSAIVMIMHIILLLPVEAVCCYLIFMLMNNVCVQSFNFI